MKQSKIAVYLEFEADLEISELTDSYRKEFTQHSGSIPTFYMIPWSENAIPHVGTRISLDCCSGDLSDLIVTDIEQSLGSKDGIRVYVKVKPTKTKDKGFVLTDQNMQELAEIGTLTESGPTVKEVLELANGL